MIKCILQYIGLAPTEHDKQIKLLVDNSWNSLQVVGRGTITIDPSEVSNSPEFKQAQLDAKQLFEDLGLDNQFS